VTVRRDRTPGPGGATYSDAVVVDLPGARWIYVAGQTPRPDEADEIPPDVGGQAEICFRQMESILGQWGAALADLVQITVYLTDLEQYPSYASVRSRVLAQAPPSSAAVGVASLLGGALVEIAGVAVTERPG
jgi:enamine deaminase RidA (YjgF/YER057c/UK114 family)